jgi:hypothetical protein
MEAISTQSNLNRCVRALSGLGVVALLLATPGSHVGYWTLGVLFAVSIGFETETDFPEPNSFRRLYRWFGVLTYRVVKHDGMDMRVSIVRNPRDSDGCTMGWVDIYVLKGKDMWHIVGSIDAKYISEVTHRLSAHLNAKIIESDDAPTYRFRVFPK